MTSRNGGNRPVAAAVWNPGLAKTERGPMDPRSERGRSDEMAVENNAQREMPAAPADPLPPNPFALLAAHFQRFPPTTPKPAPLPTLSGGPPNSFFKFPPPPFPLFPPFFFPPPTPFSPPLPPPPTLPIPPHFAPMAAAATALMAVHRHQMMVEGNGKRQREWQQKDGGGTTTLAMMMAARDERNLQFGADHSMAMNSSGMEGGGGGTKKREEEEKKMDKKKWTKNGKRRHQEGGEEGGRKGGREGEGEEREGMTRMKKRMAEKGGRLNPIVELVLKENPAVNFNTCAICGASFRLTAELVQHARSNHRQSSRYDRQQRTSIGEAQLKEKLRMGEKGTEEGKEPDERQEEAEGKGNGGDENEDGMTGNGTDNGELMAREI